MPKCKNHYWGKWGEAVTEKYLMNNGFNIREKNYRCRIGEIDIIADKEGIIIFIEVKYRKSNKYGMPREAVNYYKRQKIYKVALNYIARYQLSDVGFRFDVVEILGTEDNYSIHVIENAFQV